MLMFPVRYINVNVTSILPSKVIPPPTTTSPPTISVFAIPTELVTATAPSTTVLLSEDSPVTVRVLAAIPVASMFLLTKRSSAT